MESVIFDGKEYTKASVLAERFRYTQDYLGQLCRAKKVDARLVGRAWYINLESLDGHKSARYQAVKKTVEISPKKPSNNYLSRVDVEPILKNKTVKIFKANNGAVTELAMKYESDDYSLIPRIHREAVSANIQINQADAERLKIDKQTKKSTFTNFKPEPLPEVYLRGSLKVAGLTEAAEEDSLESESKIQPETKPGRTSPVVEQKVVTVRPRRPKGSFDMAPRHDEKVHGIYNSLSVPTPVSPSIDEVAVNKITISIQKDPEKIKSPVVLAPARQKVATVEGISLKIKKVPENPVVTPVKVPVPAVVVTKQSAQTFKPVSVVSKELRIMATPKPVSVLVPVGTLVAALLFGTLIAATNLEILVDNGSYTDRFVVQMANLSSLKDTLKR